MGKDVKPIRPVPGRQPDTSRKRAFTDSVPKTSSNASLNGGNHAFLEDEVDRTWTLSPAYDLNPSVANVLIALTWLGSAPPKRPQASEAMSITKRYFTSLFSMRS